MIRSKVSLDVAPFDASPSISIVVVPIDVVEAVLTVIVFTHVGNGVQGLLLKDTSILSDKRLLTDRVTGVPDPVTREVVALVVPSSPCVTTTGVSSADTLKVNCSGFSSTVNVN